MTVLIKEQAGKKYVQALADQIGKEGLGSEEIVISVQ